MTGVAVGNCCVVFAGGASGSGVSSASLSDAVNFYNIYTNKWTTGRMLKVCLTFYSAYLSCLIALSL